jgi:hypothetical protein
VHSHLLFRKRRGEVPGNDWLEPESPMHWLGNSSRQRELSIKAEYSLSLVPGRFAPSPSRGVHVWLFQKKIHAVEVDYTVTVVERIHSQDPANSGTALQQREVGQCGNTKFR